MEAFSKKTQPKLPQVPNVALADFQTARDLTWSPIQNAVHWLQKRQALDGSWSGYSFGNLLLESHYLLLQAWLGRSSSRVTQRIAQTLMESLGNTESPRFVNRHELTRPEVPFERTDDAIFSIAQIAINVSQIGELESGAPNESCFDFHKLDPVTLYLLALLGLVEFSLCPPINPECLLYPTWSTASLDNMSAWTKAHYVPLSIIWSTRMIRPLDMRSSKFCNPPLKPQKRSSWVGRAIHAPIRKQALRAADRWLLQRFVDSDGLSGMFLPTLLSQIALLSLGHDTQSPAVVSCDEYLSSLVVEKPSCNGLFVQPTNAPVRETAWALECMEACGMEPDHVDAKRAAEWLLDRQVVRRYDDVTGSRIAPGGWAMQRHNEYFPDIESTAMVMRVLHRFSRTQDHVTLQRYDSMANAQRTMANELWSIPFSHRVLQAQQLAHEWLLDLQNNDGGWGAFDQSNATQARNALTHHHDTVEKSCSDITATVIEYLSRWEQSTEPAAVRGLQYLVDCQNNDGSWVARWGQGSIDGTSRALMAMQAMGMKNGEAPFDSGMAYLLSRQRDDGGWCETKNVAPPATSRSSVQSTAWALLAMLTCLEPSDSRVKRAVAYLLRQQQIGGYWEDKDAYRTLVPGQQHIRSELETHCLSLKAIRLATGS